MKEIFIIEVNNNKLKKEFIDLPWKLYKDDKTWVPPLKMAIKDQLNPKHPFYKTSEMKSWIALADGKSVGRIAAFVNNAYNTYQDEKCGFFGFFESTDDTDVSEALFYTAEKWLKEQGMEKLQGPVNLSTNYEVGSLVDGYEDPPQIMMLYNKKYHEKMFDREGYTKAMDLLAYDMPMGQQLPGVICRIAERIEKKENVKIRNLNKKDWDNEVIRMHEIYNSAWEKNWGFVPMTDEEFFHTAKDLKQVVNEKLIWFVEVDGVAAGFIIALPDLNQVFHKIPTGKLLPTGLFKLLRADKYISRMRVITMGVKAEYRKMGLETLLYVKCQQAGIDMGYKTVEMSWILEDNLEMNKPIIRMGAKPYKTYRLYEKSL